MAGIVPAMMSRATAASPFGSIRSDGRIGQVDDEVALAGIARGSEVMEGAVARGDLRPDLDPGDADLLGEFAAAGLDVVLARFQPTAGHEPEGAVIRPRRIDRPHRLVGDEQQAPVRVEHQGSGNVANG